jgi:voltage-gated potassium channel
MKTIYELKKTWFGYWQRYKLKTQLKIASKLLFIFLIIWIVGSILTIFSQWAYTDNFAGTPFQCKYLKYFWPVIIELVSGYDVGNMEFNVFSDILAIIVVITGLVIFAIFTGQIVSMFIHFLQRIHHLPEKPEHFPFNRPILICGINNKLHKIIAELRKSPLTEDREIIVIDDHADQIKTGDKEMYKDVWYLKGNQGDRDVLENVMGNQETAAIILSSTPGNQTCNLYSDSRAIETAMAIEGYREKAHTVLELIDDRNIPHLKHTKINEWISIFDYGNKLVSQATLQHGMGNVYHYLLGCETGNRKTNQIYFTGSLLPPNAAGLSYKEIRDRVIERNNIDITLIGLARYIQEEKPTDIDPGSDYSYFINQINPANRECKICGTPIESSDSIGRIQKICRSCFENGKNTSGSSSNLWLFPNDTKLNREDKLIYLAPNPIDFNSIFK